MSMPEDRKKEDRQRRTERQRERRRRERVCGNCGEPADGGLIKWAGRGEPLRVPVCLRCRDRLAGHLPSWGEVQAHGIWCPVQSDRPCENCTSGVSDQRPQRGIFRRFWGV